MNLDLIQRHAAPLPRYTSYPTANHFTGAVGPRDYRDWLGALGNETALSLYVHIPYCRELCWYCGCSTKAVRRYTPVQSYVAHLEREITNVAALVPSRHRIAHLHWGGGSPDILEPAEIARLADSLRGHFHFGENAEFAVEIDPRLLTADKAHAFAAAGVNRISLGVQDFDPAVQKAIGRLQSYDATRRAVDFFRVRGVDSINIDLVYGLPHQTEASVARTIEQVLTLVPDRIAIFGYAHLPARLKHQRLIDERALPGASERFAQARRLETLLRDAGFIQVGMDHFARPHDALATAPLARNFQGYTTDSADTLIGLGASAISKMPQGYAQNAVPVEDYAHRLDAGGLATARGHALTDDDRMRAQAIERLMCDFSFSAGALAKTYGNACQPLRDTAYAIVADDADGFVEPTDDGFRLSERGRPFVRNICARFDTYLAADREKRRHALSV